MSKHRRSHHGKHRKGPGRPAVKRANTLTLELIRPGEHALVPPRCAVERALDLEEVHEMIEADELDVARDELLFLVEDCHGFLEAHNLLAELALGENDVSLARGHYGYAFENVLDALPEGFRGRLPAAEGYNPAFFAAGCGLARCLVALHQNDEARQALATLARLDPQLADVRDMQAELQEMQRVKASPLLPVLGEASAVPPEKGVDRG